MSAVARLFLTVMMVLGAVFAVPGAATAQARGAVEGKLLSVGSDTLGSLMSLWAEMLTRRHPDVLVQVRAIGSAAAPTALIQGAADIGPMSRTMSSSELAAFAAQYGYAPTAVAVARDEVAVFAHRDNPLTSIGIAQIDAAFSSTRRCGAAAPVRQWKDLGLSGVWGERPVSSYGRSTASGTYSVFRRQFLCGGDFSPRLNRLVGSSAIVHAVAQDRGAIGYASAGYLNANVRRLQLLDSQGEPVRLSRSLYLYLNRAPGTPLEPVVAAFMDIVLSPLGQREVSKAGYSPLSARTRGESRSALGLDRE